jgi:DNA polymerase elongation subunit (family B)
MKHKLKRLFFDIETSYNIGFFWNTGKQYINYTNILKERAIICICYKWEYENKVHYLHWDDNQCDKEMLASFIQVLNEADEIIGQNHENYDIKWLRTRCLFHGIPMFPKYTTLDTYKKAKSQFRLNSNSLNYISSYLNLGEKSPMTIDDWTNIIMHKKQSSLNKMIKYCKKDVLLLEQVYNKMSPYFTNSIHMGRTIGHSKLSCPECGNYSLNISKTRYTVTGIKRIQMQCSGCGKYHTVSQTTYDNG